jgi:hypothetical protein
LPFGCQSCGKVFCLEHRFHGCDEVAAASTTVQVCAKCGTVVESTVSASTSNNGHSTASSNDVNAHTCVDVKARPACFKCNAVVAPWLVTSCACRNIFCLQYRIVASFEFSIGAH